MPLPAAKCCKKASLWEIFELATSRLCPIPPPLNWDRLGGLELQWTCSQTPFFEGANKHPGGFLEAGLI